MVDPHIRKEVPDKHVVKTEGLRQEKQSSSGDSDADVAQYNELSILSFVEGT